MNLSSTLLSWLRTLIFSILLTAFSFNSILSSATQLSYADHCHSLVPASTITKYKRASFSFFSLRTGYYNGGNRILSQYSSEGSHSLSFQAQNVYRTEQDGVFSIRGFLVFPSQSTYFYLGNVTTSHFGTRVLRRRSSINFSLEGFWSESSGNLCMVGKGYIYNKEGQINLQAVLKLSNLRNSSTSITTLVTGTMESLSFSNDLSYFEPISIMILPRLNYEYTLVSKESGDEFSGANEIVKGLPISSLPSKSFCSIISRAVNEFNLRYTGDCDSSKNCGPFGAAVGYLPADVSFKRIQCLEKEKRMRVFIDFPSRGYEESDQPFNPNTKLVGEGLWDDTINQLYIVACRFLNTTDSLSNAQVGDCTTRLSLGFPSIWSIRDTSYLVGLIWSNKSVNDSGYFDKIMFKSSATPFRKFPGLRYEYTEINKARISCWPKGKPKKNKGKGYPNGYSSDMRFDMWVESSKSNTSWGTATPLSVGDVFYSRYSYPARSPNSSISGSAVQANLRDNSPVNISYIISINLRSGVFWTYKSLKFSAEGIYDAETGQLCMVGCRHIVSKNQSSVNDSKDCEVLINFQFPPSNPKMNEGYIKGSIKSTRVKSDPLYFETMDVSSVSYTTPVIRKSIKRMDLEIVIALVTNTLACVFLGLQLFHVKKQPDVLPFISFVMLSVLTLGHIVSLMLNFEALILQNHKLKSVVLGSGGWLEMNEEIARITTLVAFLLEVRLLQLSWSERWLNADQRGLWFAEMSTLFMCLPLYAAGAWILSVVNRSKQRHDFSSPSLRPQLSFSQDSKSYAGLVLDGFLLPQILLNAFRNSKENVLSSSFYFGTTFVQLLPHAYDIYRAHNYNPVGPYLYAAPNSGFYSTAWDVIILLGGLLFAAIIFLQQWLGGQCIIPPKFREGKGNEKVPVVGESQLPE